MRRDPLGNLVSVWMTQATEYRVCQPIWGRPFQSRPAAFLEAFCDCRDPGRLNTTRRQQREVAKNVTGAAVTDHAPFPKEEDSIYDGQERLDRMACHDNASSV
jgi:hypothetical protein